MKVSEAQREEIRVRVPLEDLLPEYNVSLLRAGRQWKALCPFHQEKTPSFWVNPEKQFYYCYGCGNGGDVFRFVQEIEGVGFGQALEILARRAGVVLRPDFEGSRQDRLRLELFDLEECAADQYHRLLVGDPRAEVARRYLEGRGIRREMWERFRLGYSLPDWDALSRALRGQGATDDSLERAGLARRRPNGAGIYDQFRGRLMFPITDAQGRVIGFGARTLGDDDGPKYLNTPETAIFNKSEVLYGLAQAKPAIRRSGEIAIVEGYTDVIVAHQGGLETFVASLGTAFTAENARLLQRLASRVVMIFDGDAAGQRALERSLDLLVAEEVDVRIFTVTDGKDPCDAVLALGGEEFQRRVAEDSTSIFEFKWRMAVETQGRNSPQARARGIDDCLRLAARMPNRVGRQLVLRLLAEKSGVPESEVRRRFRELSSDPGVRSREPGASRSEKRGATAAPRLADLAEVVLECLIALPSRAPALWSEVPRSVFRGELGETIAATLDEIAALPDFSGESLARRLEGEAASVVWRLLARLAAPSGRDDYELTWGLCQRDLERWVIQERITELDREIEASRSAGEEERARDLFQERLELRKQLKRFGRALARSSEPLEDVRN